MNPIVKAFLFGIVFSLGAPAYGQQTCQAVDENAYTIYVYGDSECRCYDSTFTDVIQRLTHSDGPVPVNERPLEGVIPSAITCQSALKKCQAACVQAAKRAPQPCATIQHAGITVF